MRQKKYYFNQSNLTILEGDITTSESEVIVSSDDTHISMGGGVSASILLAGGNQIRSDVAKHTPANLGDVIVTSAGTLKAKYVFHIITIDYVVDTYAYEDVLNLKNKTSVEIIFDALKRCIQLMEVLKLKTIAFPVIGTGVAAFDYKETIIIMASLLSTLLEKSITPLQASIFLYKFSDKTDKDLSRFLEEIDHILDANVNLKLLAESIELANKPSESIFSTIRSLILKSKFNILEGDIDQAFANLQSSLTLAEENNLVKVAKEIHLETDRLSKEFQNWRDKIKKAYVFNEVLEELDLQKYIQEARIIFSSSSK